MWPFDSRTHECRAERTQKTRWSLPFSDARPFPWGLCGGVVVFIYAMKQYDFIFTRMLLVLFIHSLARSTAAALALAFKPGRRRGGLWWCAYKQQLTNPMGYTTNQVWHSQAFKTLNPQSEITGFNCALLCTFSTRSLSLLPLQTRGTGR